jgi:hypothetical protein
MQQMTAAASASKAYQPSRKQFAKCSSDEQSAALRETKVNVVHMPLLRVSSRRKATAQHELPTLHADSGRQAIQGMRGKLANKITVRGSYRKSRVRFKPDDERVAQKLSPTVLLFTKSSVTASRLSRGERHFEAFKSAKTIRSLRKSGRQL